MPLTLLKHSMVAATIRMQGMAHNSILKASRRPDLGSLVDHQCLSSKHRRWGSRHRLVQPLHCVLHFPLKGAELGLHLPAQVPWEVRCQVCHPVRQHLRRLLALLLHPFPQFQFHISVPITPRRPLLDMYHPSPKLFIIRIHRTRTSRLILHTLPLFRCHLPRPVLPPLPSIPV